MHEAQIQLVSASKCFIIYFSRTCVNAEHSTYLTALNSLASFSPTSMVRGFCLFLASFSIVAASSRKSIWVPTNKNGVFWQWCEISGTHWKKNNREVSIGIQECLEWTTSEKKSHLFLDVFERAGADDGEADEEDVGLWVGERPEAVVVLLAGCVEESQCVGLAADHDCDRVIVENLDPEKWKD